MNEIIKVIKRVKANFVVNDPKDALFGPGKMDSYDMVMLITELESEYNIVIPGEKMVPEFFNSVESIQALVTELGGNK